MKTFVPNYYKQFHCIADKCRHSCCIGWDVYIDDDTLEKYENEGGAFGNRLRESICKKEEGECFEMRADGHCPFLNSCGLCDIIIEKGEDFISEICTEHPRFYNFFSDRTEIGLGLCCEEAARIILSQNEDFSLVIYDDDKEDDSLSARDQSLLSLRDKVFSVLQNRSKCITERAKDMLSAAGADIPKKSLTEWADIFKSLEIMDSNWESALNLLGKCSENSELFEFENTFEKLIIYFIYRHLADAVDNDDIAARISFAYLAFTIIRSLCKAKKEAFGECTFSDLCEFARLYSAEIEYCEDNTQKLLETLQ